MSASVAPRRASLYPTPDPPTLPPRSMEESEEESGSPGGSPRATDGRGRSTQAATPPASPESTQRLNQAAYAHLQNMSGDERRRMFPPGSQQATSVPPQVGEAHATAATPPDTLYQSPQPTMLAQPGSEGITPAQVQALAQVMRQRERREQQHLRALHQQQQEAEHGVGPIRRNPDRSETRMSPYILPLRMRNRDGSVRMAGAQQEEIAWVDIREARSAIRKLDDVFSLGHSELALATATSIASQRHVDPAYVQVMPPPFGMSHQASHAPQSMQTVQMVIRPRAATAPVPPGAGAAPVHQPVPVPVQQHPAAPAPAPAAQAPPANGSPPTLSDRRGRPPPATLQLAGQGASGPQQGNRQATL